MILSVVTTLYCSSQYVSQFYSRIVATADRLGVEYELIFVSDGSPDDSLQETLALQKKDGRVRVVELSRNFGHQKAIIAGLSVAKGERVFLIDVDLEEAPELLETFWHAMDNSSADVIYGVKQKRDGGVLPGWAADLFYRIYNVVSACRIPANLCTVRLANRQYVHALLQFKEQNVFLPGIASWVGFRQQAVVVEKLQDGSNSHGVVKKLAISWEALTSFSDFFLWGVFVVGFCLMIVSGSLVGMYLIRTFLSVTQNVSLAVLGLFSIWFVGGLIIFSVGLCGLYLSKVLAEVKGRPQYVIRHIYEGER